MSIGAGGSGVSNGQLETILMGATVEGAGGDTLEETITADEQYHIFQVHFMDHIRTAAGGDWSQEWALTSNRSRFDGGPAEPATGDTQLVEKLPWLIWAALELHGDETNALGHSTTWGHWPYFNFVESFGEPYLWEEQETLHGEFFLNGPQDEFMGMELKVIPADESPF